jgi:hypothetical protein
VRGAVYSLALLDGKILAGVNSKVVLYKLNQEGQGIRITQECAYHGNVLVIQVRTRGNFILVADLMKSVSLLMYKPATEETKFLSTIGKWTNLCLFLELISLTICFFVVLIIAHNLFDCSLSLSLSLSLPLSLSLCVFLSLRIVLLFQRKLLVIMMLIKWRLLK